MGSYKSDICIYDFKLAHAIRAYLLVVSPVNILDEIVSVASFTLTEFLSLIARTTVNSRRLVNIDTGQYDQETDTNNCKL